MAGHVPGQSAGQPGMAPGDAASGKPISSSSAPPLFLRLAILIAAVLLPSLIYSIFSAYSAYRENQEQTQQTILRFTQLAANRTELLMESTRSLLTALTTQEIASAAGVPCADRLKSLARTFNEYRSFSVIDATGRVLCSSLPGTITINLADRPWFQQAQSTNDLVISHLVISKLTNDPVVVIAMPFGPEGQPSRNVLAVAINALWLAGLPGLHDLPQQSVAFLMDREGRLITRSGSLVGSEAISASSTVDADLASLPEFKILRSAVDQNLTQVSGIGSDGVSRIYSFTNLAHSDLFIALGLPESGALGWAKREFLHQMFAALAMLLCALIGVAVGSDLLIARNIRALSATAMALQRGDYGARPTVTGASREVRQLADSLVAMAEQVQRHEQDMKRSVQQKEAMLKEIHHRVKNNLQVVTSLMSIQANRLSDEASKRALAELQRRVRALGLLHRHLYEGDDLRYLDFGQFTVELCQMVKESSGPAARAVDIQVDIPPIPITADRAVPLGLLITEALGNAFKHGFPAGQPGVIRISLSATAEGVATVSIADNGVGPSPADEAVDRRDAGTGMLLMQAFAQQLGSTLTLEGPPGTTIRFTFDLTEPGVSAPA